MIQTLTSPVLLCRSSRTMTAGTGTHCPASGRWSPNGELRHSQVFFEGSVMPTFDGAPVLWALVPEPVRH
ncbi:hypothetical protein GCM10009712_17400 [Pseudarthrobacter sulfonivorans]|uniref:hypothetical protein n=1 Tax=Pseudarthrobacter sulfonivorans TaxID=121292 RepID=UPI00168B98EE|nr:hypothetical protein [Pseudarthrobacter sulfonivorans]